MQVTCRAGGATGSAEAVFGDEELSLALMAAGELPPPVARVVWPYLALFRPAQKRLTWTRTRRLLQDLVHHVRMPTVCRKQREYAVTPAMWVAALEKMGEVRDGNLALPLKSHGYLLDVLATIAEKGEAEAERRTEEQRRLGYGRTAPDAQGDAAAAAERQALAIRINSEVQGENAMRRARGDQPMTEAERMEFIRQLREKGKS